MAGTEDLDYYRQTGICSLQSTPLFSRSGETVGMISTCWNHVHDPSDQELKLFDVLARQGADLIDHQKTRAALRELAENLDAQVQSRTLQLQKQNEELEDRTRQLKELSLRLLQTQDQERRKLARELHDSTGQVLTVLGMHAASITQQSKEVAPALTAVAQESQELIQQLNHDIRTTSYLLHPPLLDEKGLVDALRWYIQGLNERSGLDASLTISDNFGRLPNELELVIFRVVQESLANVQRHSGTKTASIRMVREGEIVRLEVSDKGQGITPERFLEIRTGHGVGIQGMRERVKIVGGEMDVISHGAGTTVRATFRVTIGFPP